MKTLSQWIKENANFTSISKKWMIENYDKFNNIYFNNELPPSDFINIDYCGPSKKGLAPTNLGCQGFDIDVYVNKSKKKGDMYIMLDCYGNAFKDVLTLKPFIYINNTIPMTMNKYEDTLLHEMVHLWVSKDCLWPEEAHGKEFTAKCDIIRKIAHDEYNTDYELTDVARGNNFDVSNIMRAYAASKKNVVGMFVHFNPVKLKNPSLANVFLFCNRNTSKKLINYIRTSYIRFEPIVYISDSFEAMCVMRRTQWKVFKTFKYFVLSEYNKPDEIEKLMTNTNEIIKIGDMNENYKGITLGRNNYYKTKYHNRIEDDVEPIEWSKNKDITICIPAGTNVTDLNIKDLFKNININDKASDAIIE